MVAVELVGVRLPPSLASAEISVRIPLSRTYGFSESFVVNWVVTDQPLTLTDGRRAPFCIASDAVAARDERSSYAYFCDAGRNRREYCVCVEPALRNQAGGAGLAGAVLGFLSWLRSPHELVERELEALTNEPTPSAWTVARRGHLYEGLFRFDEASECYERGSRAFAGRRQMFAELLERCDNRRCRWEVGDL